MSEKFIGGYTEPWLTNIIPSRKLIIEYNRTGPTELLKRLEILKRLLYSVEDDCLIEPPFHCDSGKNVTLGKHFYANYNFQLLDHRKITIGDNVKIGPNVVLASASHPIHPQLRRQDDFNILGGDIVIENDVWIGANVVVNMGVTIGTGSVIGAGSVVTKDIPPMSVAVGVPCRVVRKITDDDLKIK